MKKVTLLTLLAGLMITTATSTEAALFEPEVITTFSGSEPIETRFYQNVMDNID